MLAFVVHKQDRIMYISSFIQVVDIFVDILRLCCLSIRGTPCVLTVQTHTGLPQPLSRHSGSYSYCITAPTATTKVNLLCGIHRTQWGKKYWNTTSTQHFRIPSSSSPLSQPSDMEVHFPFGGGQ